MLIYTTATGADYRALAARQRDSLRARGFDGRWRCLTDAPVEFGADGIRCEAGAATDRAINRRQKTRLPEWCEWSPEETVVFLEADVMACASLEPLWKELQALDRVLVQRGRPQLAQMLRTQRGVEMGGEAPAPWCGLVAIPARLRVAFFTAWQQAHRELVLGYDELALLDALTPFAWGFSENIAFAGEGMAPLIHYQGAAKLDISPGMAAAVAAQRSRLLALAEGADPAHCVRRVNVGEAQLLPAEPNHLGGRRDLPRLAARPSNR